MTGNSVNNHHENQGKKSKIPITREAVLNHSALLGFPYQNLIKLSFKKDLGEENPTNVLTIILRVVIHVNWWL